jgi:hypothetical protein
MPLSAISGYQVFWWVTTFDNPLRIQAWKSDLCWWNDDRIVDNMPVTWCYQTEGAQTYCSTGFPIGCFNKQGSKTKNACSYLVLGNK